MKDRLLTQSKEPADAAFRLVTAAFDSADMKIGGQDATIDRYVAGCACVAIFLAKLPNRGRLFGIADGERRHDVVRLSDAGRKR